MLRGLSCSSFCVNIFSLLLGICQFSGIAGLYACPMFKLVRTARQFSKAVASIKISTAMSEDSNFSASMLTLVTVQLVGLSHPSGCEVASHCS